jgi:branched-chain amino acid aminotransferase
VGFSANISAEGLAAIVGEVVDHNEKLIPVGHDLGITLFVTAGLNLTYVGAAGLEACRRPSVCVHTFPLPFELWADKLDAGQHLVTPSIRHIPPDSLDPKIKSRSRLHWYLADRQARLADPHAGALVLDRDGNIAETSSGNFFIVRDGIICTPSHRTTLGGVSQQVVTELAADLGIECVNTDLQVYDALNATEAFTSSTPYCLLPVTKLNGQAIGDGEPGPVVGKLLAAWSEMVGLDVAEQIRRGARERVSA